MGGRRELGVVARTSRYRIELSDADRRELERRAGTPTLPWLNQIEIYFSILQRKALTPNDFEDLEALTARITAFENDYRQIAEPFQ